MVVSDSRQKPTFLTLDRPSIFLSGTISALFVIWAFLFYFSALHNIHIFNNSQTNPTANHTNHNTLNIQFDDPHGSTFYDEPSFGYTLDKSVENWDEKRRAWFKLHPSFEPMSHERILVVTGSQSNPCLSPTGDHFLLRFFRNKVDYCRIHGYDIFYNNVLLDPNMIYGWAKLPAVRAAMMAHPEAEWIWWLDEDTAITDMEFKIPLHRYKDYNFVVHGWPKEVYEMKSWLGLNDGSFLIRNCQWSLDFLDTWADMGRGSPNFDKWEKVLLDVFKHKSTDQTALAYLLYKEHQQWWAKKMLIETTYFLEGYWVGIVKRLDNITEMYHEMEMKEGMLRRRHAEKVSEQYALLREPLLKDSGHHESGWRRPFVTHFAGCQPCNGKHNPIFTSEGCRKGMNKALNFADNQVLRNYGYMHPNLLNPSFVSPLAFDYPKPKMNAMKN